MAYLEKTKGQGWWGNENYRNYYSNLENEENPFGWIKVIPTMNSEVQIATGYDHAGKFESSMLMALYPKAVELGRLGTMKHWYTESAADANRELGKRMIKLSLEYLEKVIC